MLTGRIDPLQMGELAAQRAVPHDVGHPENRVQGGADFMAHVGEESAFAWFAMSAVWRAASVRWSAFDQGFEVMAVLIHSWARRFSR